VGAFMPQKSTLPYSLCRHTLRRKRVTTFVVQATFEYVLGNEFEGFCGADTGTRGYVRDTGAEVAFVSNLPRRSVLPDVRRFDDFYRAEGSGDYAVFTADTLLRVNNDRPVFYADCTGGTRLFACGIFAVPALDRRGKFCRFYHKELGVKRIPVRVDFENALAFVGDDAGYHAGSTPDTAVGVCLNKLIHSELPPKLIRFYTFNTNDTPVLTILQVFLQYQST
jgi:hypothetical protein